MTKLIHPKLSYKINGILFKVYNNLGYGYQERVYQKAIELEFKKNKLGYDRELKINLIYDRHKIGKYYLDFLVDDKIIIEIKTGNYFHKKDYSQIKNYLKVHKLELGILALFSPDKVEIKRILNKID